MRTIAVMSAALLVIALTSVLAARADEHGPFTDHGVGAEVSRSRGVTATVDGDGNRVVLVWMMDHGGTRSKLIIDADTGETEQIEFERPIHDSPFAVLHSTRNLWYSQFANRFYEFDPEARSFTFIGETPTRCAMSMHEDEEGVIWAGLYPNGELISFDPDTRELVNHGRMNEETWPQYLRSMAVDQAGWVYAGIGTTRAQVAGYNPETGEMHTFIPEDQRESGTGEVRLGVDGNVYALARGWGWHRLDAGEATSIDEMPVDRAPMRTGSQGSVFRGFPDGSRIAQLNIPDRILVIEEADGTERRVDFDYESEGSLIYTLTLAPDNAIYGSTGHPLRVFRFDLETGDLSDRALPGGHLNQMITMGDLVYGGNYAGGTLHEFDVTQPWDPGDEEDSNPINLGSARPDIIRPHVLLGHPDGRHVLMGGTPAYGHTGGGLMIYDTEERDYTVIPHTDLLEHQAPTSLVALPGGDLVGGTTTAPGTGGERLADEAELFVFDWENREVVWREAIVPGVQRLNEVVLAPDGLVYGIATDATLFVFDPEAREIVHEESLEEYGRPAGSQAPRSMVLGPDDTIYMLFTGAIVALTPGSFEHEKLADSPTPITAGVVLHDGRIYFSSRSHLWSYELQ